MQRVTVQLPEKLVGDLDAWVERHGFADRSEAVRHLVRTAVNGAP